MGKTELTGHIYNIFPLTEIPAIEYQLLLGLTIKISPTISGL